MNKAYKSVWNEALGAWVAVSEIETSRGKRGSSKSVVNMNPREGRVTAQRTFGLSAISLALLGMFYIAPTQAL